MDEGLAVVLKHIDLLKANIMKFLNLLPSISRSPYITPKTSVLDSLRILDTLIYDIEDLIQEDKPIADVKDQIKILHQRLISLLSSIKQVWSQQPSQIVELREPLMRMGDMAHEAEYLIISYKAGDVPHWYVINKLTNINHKIELIGKELHEIAKKYEFGGLEVVRAQPLLQAKRNNEVDDVTVGFEDKEKDILDKLVGEGTEQLQVIAIFGMPGIGKTTLARKSYNHPIVKNWFYRQSWCVVSQTYHRQSILAGILTNLETELEKDEILKMEEERLVETIYKLLMGRRYLVVMDDVWDSNMWDDLRRCFPDDGNGSKIMFTSRNKNVAPPNSIIYAQTNLSNDCCWELLEKRLFGNKPCPSELLEIGKRIAAKCRGLPLVVVVIAGVLSTMDKEKTTWKEVEKNLATYFIDGVDNTPVMEILERSYRHLPDHLKPCFLYFGKFEEDNEISARTLMRLWIAEGFVHKEKEKSAENVAEEYLMELIDKSLVMVAKRSSDGGVKACVIHDLLLDLCSKISKDENLVKFVNMEFSTIPKPMLPERRKRNNSTADFLSESVSAFLAEIMKQRKWRYRYRDEEEEFERRAVHISIVLGYSSFFSRTCDMGKLPCTASFIRNLNFAESASPTRTVFREVVASFAQELQEFLVVPRPDKFHESNNRIKKYQLLEAFISFLLQLLSHKTDPIINLYGDRIGNLEKELRFLHSILEDESLMVCADDEHIKFQELLAEFEDVANEAGRLVHSLFFTIHIQASREMDEGLAVVLNHIDLLKPNIMKFLNLLPSISRSAYITPKTSVLDSLRILDTLICDLEDLIQEDNPIADVKDQIKILHQRLISLQSSIKRVRSQQPSQIVELREPLMRMGDMAHGAEYLIISFKAGDVPHWYVNHKIELLGKELHEIAKKYEFGGLEVVRAQPLLQAKRNNEVDDVTVGFEDKETYILDKLVGGGTEQLQVIAIFGMPGIGKTTLAKKLYNHRMIKDRFDRQSWCAVSQTYHRQGLLAGILTDLESKPKKDKILEMEEERLVEAIYQTLKGRRYLVVMDDVWDSKVWDVLWRCFPDDGYGSKILFTSRNKDVAPPNSIIYAQTNWSNDRCWELLEKRLFGNKPCPSELLEIGKRIAANCGGLPLTVVVIAGVLSTMDKEKTTWKEVEENLASYIFDGGDNSSVMQILELSYKHLPDHLKPCFLCFGKFEEDSKISARILMRLWIAEGFVHKEKEKSVENVAEEYLMELIDKSLVMVAERRSDGGVKACVIHDLLLDLCKKISKDENFLKFVNIDYHTLFHQHGRTSPFYFWGTSPFYVRDLRILRVLFSFSPDPYRYNRIEYLVNLRYLIIEDLPPYIGSLVNLEYLSVHRAPILNLPLAILTMRKLRYLEVPNGAFVIYEATHDKYCNSYQTINLEFLSRINIWSLKDEEMLKCSPRLRELKCYWIPYSNTEERTRNMDLSFLTQLELLNVRLMGGRELEEIRFPPNIRKLALDGFTLSWEKMSIIGRLEKLELLKLRHCPLGKRWDTRDGEFQKLKFLKLSGGLTEWNVESSQHFPMLQRLFFYGCPDLKEIPSEIGDIPTLQMIEIQGACRKSMAESARRIQQEQSDLGNEELRIIINPTTMYE